MNVFKLTNTLDEYVDFYNNSELEAEVLVVGGSKIELEKYPNLKYIFKCGVGIDNIPDLRQTGIELVMPSEKTKNVIFDEVSSFTIYLLMLSHFRNVGDIKNWSKKQRSDLSSKKCLVIGHKGNIGSRVLNKCKSMGLKCKGYDVDTKGSLEGVVSDSDIITIHCPLTDNTRECIKTEWLKNDTILVNTARAGLVNENDLFNFLSSNPFSVAAFDVFWEEPYKGKLLNLDNFIATPHIASMGRGFKEGLFEDLNKLLEK